MAGGTDGLEQKCTGFYSVNWWINTNDGPEKSYYICQINGSLENDQEVVTTDTSENTKSNAEVPAVYYQHSQTVKFIPNSLFATFVNLEYLVISFGNKFETMKREYLQNAKKLKNLKIFTNSVKKLDGNVFSKAKSLEHINFYKNQIESIHKEAFNGLPNLQGVYLDKNKIKILHLETFSSISNLNDLGLKGDENCVNEKFTSANQNFPQIEAKISSGCTYKPFPDEVNAIQNLAEKNKIKIQEFNDKIGNLTAEAQAKQQKFDEMTNQLEKMKAELSSQQEKQVKELAEQQKEFDAKIASEKLQLEAKITQLETKLAIQQKECKTELQLESTSLQNQIDSKFTQMEAKLTAQKIKHKVEKGKLAGQIMTLQNIDFSLVDRINDQKDWNRKYSDEIGTTCENNLRLVQIRLAVLENKNG